MLFNSPYIFQEFDDNLNDYIPVFKIISHGDESYERAKHDPDFIRINTFTNQGVFEKDMIPFKIQKILQHKYFWQPFDIPKPLKPPKKRIRILINKTSRKNISSFLIVLNRNQYDNISSIISDHKLGEIRDLLFYLIARAQYLHITKHQLYRETQKQNDAKNIRSELKKLSELLKRMELTADYLSGKSDPPSRIRGIKFLMNDKDVKINNHFIASLFISYFKEMRTKNFSDGWEDTIFDIENIFSDNLLKNKFKYELAIAYYKLLTAPLIAKNKYKTKYPDDLMTCIAKLLEASDISIGKDWQTDVEKGNLVRTWFINLNL